jgi:glycosyltransferase involved in cell wall biosynthesis
MKVLFINSLYAPHIGGGAEIILQRTVEGLQNQGVQVSVLATGPEPGLSLSWINEVKVYRAGLLNTYWHFSQQHPGRLARLGWHLRDRYNAGMRGYVREVLAAECVDLVVCHNLSGWSVSVWDEITQAGLPIVQVLHDMYLLCPTSTMFKKGQSCQRQCTLCRQFRQGHAQRSAQVDTVVGVSRYVLEQLLQRGYFQGSQSHVLHNGNPASLPIKRPTRTNDSVPLRFGYMGTLSEAKGLRWLIEQFQRLPFNATLQIAGRGQLDYEAQLKKLATSPRISFVGYQAPEHFYPHIDVALVPSIWAEPFGMVAVEACAHSLPVIASRMGGLPEIIQDQINGLLCSPDDPHSLGRAMLRLYQQPQLRAQLGAKARASIAALLSLEPMLEGYQRIFRQTLHRRAQRHESRPLSQPI